MSLPTILLILAVLSIGATIIAIIIAFRSDREAKSAIFPIIREEEAVRAQRARVSVFVWAAVTALFIGGWLASLRLGLGTDAETVAEQPGETAEVTAVAETSQTEVVDSDDEAASQAPVVEAVPTEEPTPTATIPPVEQSPTETSTPVDPSATPLPPTDTPIPSDTPLSPTDTPLPSDTPLPPTATPIPTHTATPEPTATPLPTDTPTPPLASLVRIPTTAPRTPAPSGARMGPIQFSTEISSDNEAINPDDTFTEGVEAVYAVFPYSGMENGVDFKVIWYQNGQELWREESEWEWGDEARFYSFITSPNEGLYKLELVVNDSVLATDLFEIR